MYIRNLSLAILLLVPILSGCALTDRRKTSHEVTEHPHRYPHTEVMGKYHVRLDVVHDEGKMYLIFEDISEEPVKLLTEEKIRGKVKLPEGTIKKEHFHATKQIYRKKRISRSKERRVGTYVALGEWLRTEHAFVLEINVRLRGRWHKLSFDYDRQK
jgi:hypothetical protein